ncbi:MAG: heavy metal translocating P-type ATPase [Phycisphaeraceae bacterium]
MTTRSLRMPITLPADAARRRVCAPCIQERLARRAGVKRAEVVAADDGCDKAFLELDYDDQQLSLSQINGYLRGAGSCFAPTMQQVVLPARGIGSGHDERMIQRAMERLPGVRCIVNGATQTVRLEFDRALCTLERIEQELDVLGVKSDGQSSPLETTHPRSAPAATLQLPGPNWLRLAAAQMDFVMAVLAGVFLLAGFLVYMLGGPQPIRLALLFVSYICGGFYPSQDTVRTLLRLRLDIDVLMFAAAFGAAALGHYEEGAMLLFLFSLGGAGENLAMNRARSAIQALTRLAPQTAMLILDSGERREVGVEELRIGDRVFVAPGQQVPADGNIVQGASAVNQAPITGESIPVEKTQGDPVFAGTLNGNGALEVQVLKRAQDNTLSKLIRMVEEAQSTKSPTQAFTDKVEQWYVPLVVVATVLVAVVPPLAGLEPRREHASDWAGWFYQAMAFLTAASPCALAIGTPAAVLSGIARAARSGVLIKGGIHLENLGRVRAIAFDKTGTLTMGRPRVTDVVPVGDETGRQGDEETRGQATDATRLAGDAQRPTASEISNSILALAAAVERGSRHPLAQAIVRAAEERGLTTLAAEQVEQTPGMGIRGNVEGRDIHVGRVSHADNGEVAALEEMGKTVVAVSEGQRMLALIALADEPRPGVNQMIAQLRALGIRQTIMLTGDNERTAAAIAKHVGIDQYEANLMPEQKLARIRELDREHGRVAMVGDGVNDAPALANATVGIAIGGAGVSPSTTPGGGAGEPTSRAGEDTSGAGGSDVAMETADIVILGKDLHRMAEAIGISRFSRHIILQNLLIALGVIAVVAPVAALGFAPISAAVLLHEGSTVLVVLNALRILRYRPKSA